MPTCSPTYNASSAAAGNHNGEWRLFRSREIENDFFGNPRTVAFPSSTVIEETNGQAIQPLTPQVLTLRQNILPTGLFPSLSQLSTLRGSSRQVEYRQEEEVLLVNKNKKNYDNSNIIRIINDALNILEKDKADMSDGFK